MTINHAGILKKEYFISYLTLIMNAHGCDIDAAKQYTLNRLFGGDIMSMGESTYQNFLLAVADFQHLCCEGSE
ncbi:hypothetical protein [Priestia koreensis]|uniref:Uncharacterized protein n=1 Tax=Priestia koreensis TaxID=284581 RepID=A0A0M0KWG1_9BACI|nr:hypothetical protein [Priestia koreensis]KOO42728.1 hypothetical protein AMD01_16405 [Priestia koreensis]MCM3005528.1 hypothetical protein [Priestia koreensis]